MPPTDDQLRRFLAGTLPAAEADRVAAWLDSDPTAADRLAGLGDPDALAQALLKGGTPIPTGPRADGSLEALASEMRGGEYRVVRELGRGGMGVVEEAENPRLRRRVAIKRMLPAVAARPDAKARFLREARAMAAVASDHIVPVLHVGEQADGTPYLVMPLLTGETLAARLARGPLPDDELRRVARDTAAGLADVHARGLIHRDIKPSNLWLEANPDGTVRRVRILDFGLALPQAAVGALTDSHVVVGTPKYMSPEQARGATVGPPSDLFSLGCVLYRAAADRPPFDGETVTAVLTKLAVDEPLPVRELAPAVPPDLADLIHALLRKKPEERPTAVDVLTRMNRAGAAPRRWAAVAAGIAVAATAVALAAILLRNGTTEAERGAEKWPAVQNGDRPVIAPAPLPPPELAPPPRPATALAADDDWEVRTKRLPREEQFTEVLAELRRRNPDAQPEDFNIQPTRTNDTAGVLLVAHINTDEVRDLTPLRAVNAGRLHRVYLRSQAKPKAFAALAQLRGVPVDGLGLSGLHGVTDLTALNGMPLTFLDLSNSPVSDLTPVADLPLKTLRLYETAVADLAPIRRLKLAHLDYGRPFDPDGTGFGGVSTVSTLEPLKDMPLERLDLGDCKVRDLRPVPTDRLKTVCLRMAFPDLSPLAGSGIETLHLYDAVTHLAVVKALPKLKSVSSTFPYQTDATPRRLLDTIDLRERRDAEFFAAAERLTGDALVAAVEAEMEARTRARYEAMGLPLPPDGSWKPKLGYERVNGKVVGVIVTRPGMDLTPVAALRDARKLTLLDCPGLGIGFRAVARLPLTELDVQNGARYFVTGHLDTLARMPTLKAINGQTAADFRKEHGIELIGTK